MGSVRKMFNIKVLKQFSWLWVDNMTYAYNGNKNVNINVQSTVAVKKKIAIFIKLGCGGGLY